MEKFYIVTEESGLRKEYLDYRQNRKLINDLVKEFCQIHNIKSDEYYATNEQIYIVPTEEDITQFDKILGKQVNQGLRPFKKLSKVNKEWVKILKDKNLKVFSKPYLAFYFNNCYGRHRTRLFDIDGIVYCSMNLLESEYDFQTPEGMKEIKASEFFKIVEDYEQSN